MGHTGMKPIQEKKQTCGKIAALIAGVAGAVLPMTASADGEPVDYANPSMELVFYAEA